MYKGKKSKQNQQSQSISHCLGRPGAASNRLQKRMLALIRSASRHAVP